MRIAILHLSDFHIKETDLFLDSKINAIVSSLNVLNDIDDYIIVFSGDLAFSGKKEQYLKARQILNKIITGIKELNNGKFVNLFMVPGNHDLDLSKTTRKRKDIQDNYNSKRISEYVKLEYPLLNDYYLYSRKNGFIPNDHFLYKKIYENNGYKIQFNLINTAFFSTLEPNDKEIHYFPLNKIERLDKSNDANLCITVMHHSFEWFSWECKNHLQKAIIDNSEFLLYGHDHVNLTSTISLNNSCDTRISAAGEMTFSDFKANDSYNAIVIDTDNNTFDGYSFVWDNENQYYEHKEIAKTEKIQKHNDAIRPSSSFIMQLKEDNYNSSDDFTKYFVFPKLEPSLKDDVDKTITTIEDFEKILLDKRKIIISGQSNSGKTTLLKYFYLSLFDDKKPLLLDASNRQRLRKDSFIKNLFEDQYGKDYSLFAKYEQLSKDDRVILIDGWDLLKMPKNEATFIKQLEDFFGYIVICMSNTRTNIINNIKEDLEESNPFYELKIKPFFFEKRNELVKSVCFVNLLDDAKANNINKLIDSLVDNNGGLFSLNPAFIVRYTKYFIEKPELDYSKGESVFNQIFEYELNSKILEYAKKQDLDEMKISYEEFAGFMYSHKKDTLTIQEVTSIIDTYNSEYGEKISVKTVIEVGTRSRLLKQFDDLSIRFNNKNHLAYFIAKYLIRIAQDDPSDRSGIDYALANICFGINSDIILFMSYLLNDLKILASITEYANKMLEESEELSLDQKNISLLHNVKAEDVKPPAKREEREYAKNKEKNEEKQYSNEIIETRGIFDYDDEDVADFNNKVTCAIKYTEMICKALPSFHNRLKKSQKIELVDTIYKYPRKIVYMFLRPLDMDLESTCNDILEFIEYNNIKKKNGEQYTNEDVLRLLNNTGRALMLSMFDHFSELATSPKIIDILIDREIGDSSEEIQRLLIIENSGNTDMLLNEAEALLKKYKGTEIESLIKLIVKKHLLTNKNLTYNTRQKITDRIFGKKYRKQMLIDNYKY